MTSLWAIILALISAIFCGIGPIFLKKGAENFSVRNPKKSLKNKNLLKGIGMYLLATIFFIPALKGGEMSVLYPMASTAYVWLGIFSMGMTKERMSLLKWVGTCILVLGILIIGLGIPMI